MKKNNHIDITWILLGLWMAGSFIGILYSFRFLLSAVICLALALMMYPREKRADSGFEALERVWKWQRDGGAPPDQDTFRRAADFYMYRDFGDIRKEDLNTWQAADVPAEVRPYILSERDLPRRSGMIF